MIEKLRQAAQQALEALKAGLDFDPIFAGETEGALRAALPVAWLDQDINCAYTAAEMDGESTDGLVPLYTATPQREPLTAQEPVAWMTHENDLLPLFHGTRSGALAWGSEPQPLYIAPPQHDALLEALRFIANHDLRGADLNVCGHIAHALVGKARDAIKAAEGDKE